MSDYKYTSSHHADTLEINKATVHDDTVFLAIQESTHSKRDALIYIPNADAPTVAAELLKAAGWEGVFVAAGDMPTYTVRGNYLHFLRPDGKEHAIGTYESAEDLTRVARYNLVAAEYIENKAQRETEAAKKLQERRNAITREIMRNDDDLPVTDYASLTWYAQKAVDRIIELEDGKADA